MNPRIVGSHAGVVLQPDRASALVVRDRSFMRVEPASPARADVEGLLAGLAVTGSVRPTSVTVDISSLLLDAVLTARDLPAVAVIRILPRPSSDPSLARSPEPLVERLIRRRFSIAGGHDLLGHELYPLDRGALAATCAQLADSDVRHVAIVSSGSQARPAHERDVADAVQAAVPGARISVAHDYGGQGLVAREATVVLDCAVSVLTAALLDRCERTLRRLPGVIALRVARGDGGYSTPSRIRAMPVVAFGATDALQLAGAAHLAGEANCRVILTRADRVLAGEVRHGVPLVSPAAPPGFGAELVVPTAVLASVTALGRPGNGDEVTSHRQGDTVVRPAHDADTLACVGAAVSRPAAWLDEIAYITSAEQLEGVRRDAVERATAIVMANGAAPDSHFRTDVLAVALPYSPSGTVRIRVRVTGDPDPGAPDEVVAVGRVG